MAAPITPATPPPAPAAGLAQGDLGGLQNNPLPVPANVKPADAQATFLDRTSQLLAGGLSPQAAVAGAAQAVQQMGAATTRSGGDTPAQALGDSLATGGSSSSPASPALAAALAQGQSPAQALATAATAAQTAASMQAAATVPTAPGNIAAAALAGSGVPVGVPNPAAFAQALASGMSPAAALEASRIAARTSAEMTARATLPTTEGRQAAAALADGDLANMSGVTGNRTAEAALAATLARGGSIDDALAAAARAAASLDDQQRRGSVPVSDDDACKAAMAAGAAGGCGGGGSGTQTQQLQTAAVQADDNATALAEGRMPSVDADAEVVGRLLRLGADPQAIQRMLASWNAAAERQTDAARVATPGDVAALRERLSQGRTTQADVEQIISMARTESLAGLARWLRTLGQAGEAVPQADRRPASGDGG